MFISIPWAPFFIPNRYEKDRTEQCGSVAALSRAPTEAEMQTHVSVCVISFFCFSVGVLFRSPLTVCRAALFTCDEEASNRIFRHVVYGLIAWNIYLNFDRRQTWSLIGHLTLCDWNNTLMLLTFQPQIQYVYCLFTVNLSSLVDFVKKCSCMIPEILHRPCVLIKFEVFMKSKQARSFLQTLNCVPFNII